MDHQAELGRRSCESLAAEDSGTATVGLSKEADLDESEVNKESGLFKFSFFFPSTSESNNQSVLYDQCFKASFHKDERTVLDTGLEA